MVKPGEREPLLVSFGFWEEDFTDLGLNDDAKERYHTYLGIDINGPYSFIVDSSDPKHPPYVVGHDYDTCLTCTCLYFLKRGGFCKHRKRGNLVLQRWKEHNRLATLTEQVIEEPVLTLSQRDFENSSSLNRSEKDPGFSILKKAV